MTYSVWFCCFRCSRIATVGAKNRYLQNISRLAGPYQHGVASHGNQTCDCHRLRSSGWISLLDRWWGLFYLSFLGFILWYTLPGPDLGTASPCGDGKRGFINIKKDDTQRYKSVQPTANFPKKCHNVLPSDYVNDNTPWVFMLCLWN